MSNTYGVTPTGFVRKSIAQILDEREQAMVATFGAGVIQTPQSPLGQINGLLSDIEAALWEIAEDTYQSFDTDQAEGIRLDQLARLRLIERAPGETDAQIARALTNADRANVRDADFYRAIVNIDGVTFARIYANDSGSVDANGMAPHSVCVAVLGGDDEEIATTARRYIVPGISSYGNTAVSTTIEGFCRTIYIMRPTIVPVSLSIDVYRRSDKNGCPPPPIATIAAAVVSGLTGDNQPANGDDITKHLVTVAVSCEFPNVEVAAVRASRSPATPSAVPLVIAFNEIAMIASQRVAVIAL